MFLVGRMGTLRKSKYYDLSESICSFDYSQTAIFSIETRFPELYPMCFHLFFSSLQLTTVPFMVHRWSINDSQSLQMLNSQLPRA